MKNQEIDHMVNLLFEEQLEDDAWLNQYQRPDKLHEFSDLMTHRKGLETANKSQSQQEPSTTPGKDNEVPEVFLDINFYRDLGPLSRQILAKNDKQTRKTQKRILNHLIDLEPSQKNFYDDVFMLALSGQVPVDKLLARLEHLKVDCPLSEKKKALDIKDYVDTIGTGPE